MSEDVTQHIRFPRLKGLDPKDVAAVRGFFPGRVIGFMSALFALAAGALSTLTVVREMLLSSCGIDLVKDSWLRNIFLLVCASVALIYVTTEILAKLIQARRKALAIAPTQVPNGYFRIGPYEDTEQDIASFHRSDRLQERILKWLKNTEGAPLYLTGQSGCGKSSILQAYIIPTLRNEEWTIVVARAWQPPLLSLANALSGLASARGGGTTGQVDLRSQIEAVARRAKNGLLILIDQFEQFGILESDERARVEFAAFVEDLYTRPIKKLRFVLVFRSDYRPALDDLNLPPLRERENWQEVGAFLRPAGADFLTKAKLGLQPATLDTLLTSIADLDRLSGLLRPVTLNVVGFVLAHGRSQVHTLDAGTLVDTYVSQAIAAPEVRDCAPAVLRQLVTKGATTCPRSEADLISITKLRRGEVRAVLNGLANAGLARPIQSESGVWELSHDFVAQVIALQLRRKRRSPLQQISIGVACFAFFSLIVAGGYVAWQFIRLRLAEAEIADRGLPVAYIDGHYIAESDSHWSRTNVAPALKVLHVFGRDLTTVIINNNTVPLDLEQFDGIHSIEGLFLSSTPIATIYPLRSWKNLRYLDLSFTRPTSTFHLGLEVLPDLQSLRTLSLTDTGVSGADLRYVSAVKQLRWLDLSVNHGVQDVTALADADTLDTLDLSDTDVADVYPLGRLGNLRCLNLAKTKVIDLRPFWRLQKLRQIVLANPRLGEAGREALQQNAASFNQNRAAFGFPVVNLVMQDGDPLLAECRAKQDGL